MRTLTILFFSFVFLVGGLSSSLAGMATQVGIGYGKEWRGNLDLAQYELFWRGPLPYETTLGGNWNVSAGIELGLGLIKESGSGHSGTGRFSLMPQVVISPNGMVNFIFGLGAGYMAGTTEFTDHNLGGRFLLNSKVGVQIVLGGHWGVEYVFYHQSNAGIYDNNASLNMHQLGVSYNF